MTCIYCLYSTADGRPRYVGQTTKEPAVRLSQHRRDAGRHDGRLQRWIRQVSANGFQVRIHVVQTNVHPRDLNTFERYWMAQFRGLLNDGPGTPSVSADTAIGRAVHQQLRRHLQNIGPAILGLAR